MHTLHNTAGDLRRPERGWMDVPYPERAVRQLRRAGGRSGRQRTPIAAGHRRAAGRS